jgi:hypothetical protein
VRFRLAKEGRIAEQRKMRRVLLRKDEGDADVGELQQGPGFILIGNFATPRCFSRH